MIYLILLYFMVNSFFTGLFWKDATVTERITTFLIIPFVMIYTLLENIPIKIKLTYWYFFKFDKFKNIKKIRNTRKQGYLKFLFNKVILKFEKRCGHKDLVELERNYPDGYVKEQCNKCYKIIYTDL